MNDNSPGVYTTYKPFLQKDKNIIKKLMSGVSSKRPYEVQSAILRRHLLELTQSFMIPLERYIASLMPLQKSISPFKVKQNTEHFFKLQLNNFFSILCLSSLFLSFHQWLPYFSISFSSHSAVLNFFVLLFLFPFLFPCPFGHSFLCLLSYYSPFTFPSFLYTFFLSLLPFLSNLLISSCFCFIVSCSSALYFSSNYSLLHSLFFLPHLF